LCPCQPFSSLIGPRHRLFLRRDSEAERTKDTRTIKHNCAQVKFCANSHDDAHEQQDCLFETSMTVQQAADRPRRPAPRPRQGAGCGTLRLLVARQEPAQVFQHPRIQAPHPLECPARCG